MLFDILQEFLEKNGFDTKLPDSDLTNYKIPTRQLKREEGTKKTHQNTNNNGKFSSLKLKKSLKIPKAQSEPETTFI
jgi:hypothetical protein